MRASEPFRRLFRLVARSPRDVAREVNDELETHLALRANQLLSAGLSEGEAQQEALRRFGNVDETRDVLTHRAQRRAKRMRLKDLLDSIRYDAFFSLRQIRRSPAASLFAIASLALGIGLTTSFFAIVNGVMLRPLPFREPSQLVSLKGLDSLAQKVYTVSADDWFDWTRSNNTFSGIALYSITSRAPLSADDGAIRVSSVSVTPGFFDVVGAKILLGRGLQDSDASRNTYTAVISEGLWRRALGGRPLPLSIRAYGVKFEIVGVVASGQELPADAEFWSAYAHQQRGGAVRNNINWVAVGRLKPGVSLPQATADLKRIDDGIRATDKMALYSYGVYVQPLRDMLVGDSTRYLVMLMGAVLCVLLIACANLASINLARGTARAREMAVRAAIGAGRGRLIRQLLVEHMMLAFVGGALGTALAFVLTRSLVSLAANELPRAGEISVDGSVLLFTAVATVLVGVLTGLLPSLQAGRASLVATMAAVGRASVGGNARTGRALVAVEIALAVILVAGAGLLMQSFRTLLAQSLGYETQGIVTAEVTLTGARYRNHADVIANFWRTELTELRADPAVADAALVNWVPLGIGPQSFITVEGRDEQLGGGYRVVSDGYFSTLRIPLLRGRAFTADDNASVGRVGVVSEAMAKSFWPNQDPIGKRLRAPSMEAFGGQTADWITIVGEVGDVRHGGPESEITPQLYVAYQQLPFRMTSLTLMVRAKKSIASLMPVVRQRIHEVDPDIAADFGTLSQRFDGKTAERRFTMFILLLFGVLALALAAIGVYSVLAFQVAQRTRELALRSALGADRGRLLQLVMRSAVQVIAVGVVLGLIASRMLSQVMQSLVFGVNPHDPMVLGLSTLVIVVVALLAALAPAVRATKIAPMVALQSE